MAKKTAHRTPAQIRAHNREYGSKPRVMKKDRDDHRARRKAIKEGRVKKGSGMELDHKKPSVSGGSNAKSNLRVVPRSVNRAKAGKTTAARSRAKK